MHFKKCGTVAALLSRTRLSGSRPRWRATMFIGLNKPMNMSHRQGQLYPPIDICYLLQSGPKRRTSISCLGHSKFQSSSHHSFLPASKNQISPLADLSLVHEGQKPPRKPSPRKPSPHRSIILPNQDVEIDTPQDVSAQRTSSTSREVDNRTHMPGKRSELSRIRHAARYSRTLTCSLARLERPVYKNCRINEQSVVNHNQHLLSSKIWHALVTAGVTFTESSIGYLHDWLGTSTSELAHMNPAELLRCIIPYIFCGGRHLPGTFEVVGDCTEHTYRLWDILKLGRFGPLIAKIERSRDRTQIHKNSLFIFFQQLFLLGVIRFPRCKPLRRRHRRVLLMQGPSRESGVEADYKKRLIPTDMNDNPEGVKENIFKGGDGGTGALRRGYKQNTGDFDESDTGKNQNPGIVLDAGMVTPILDGKPPT